MFINCTAYYNIFTIYFNMKFILSCLQVKLHGEIKQIVKQAKNKVYILK